MNWLIEYLETLVRPEIKGKTDKIHKILQGETFILIMQIDFSLESRQILTSLVPPPEINNETVWISI